MLHFISKKSGCCGCGAGENLRQKMENLEEALNYSRDYLTRSFQRDRGMTPHRYLTMLRIGHAKWMLANTACSVREIAEACGYADLSVFNRAFRALTGRTPTQWQKENR